MQMKDPVLSVITVCYNAESEIRNTIKSIIPFINNNVEYIIIDGQSSDGTLQIIHDYKAFISICISEPDTGIYDAMNKGISHAKGRWILFINIGDQLLNIPSALFDKKSESYDAIACSVLSENEKILSPYYNRCVLIHNTIPHQGLFYNQFRTIPNFDTTYGVYSDYDYNLYLYKNKKKLLILNEIVAFHSLFGISNDKKNVKELFAVIRRQNGWVYVFFSKIYFHLKGLKFKLWKCMKID